MARGMHRIALVVECVVMNSKRIWKRMKKKLDTYNHILHKCMDEAKGRHLRGASESEALSGRQMKGTVMIDVPRR